LENAGKPDRQIREHVAAIQFVQHFVPSADTINVDDPNFDRDLSWPSVSVRPVNQSGRFRAVG
jgi:hypothetical protein